MPRIAVAAAGMHDTCGRTNGVVAERSVSPGPSHELAEPKPIAPILNQPVPAIADEDAHRAQPPSPSTLVESDPAEASAAAGDRSPGIGATASWACAERDL